MSREATFGRGTRVRENSRWLRLAELRGPFFQTPLSRCAGSGGPGFPIALTPFSERSGVAPFGRTGGGSCRPSLDRGNLMQAQPRQGRKRDSSGFLAGASSRGPAGR